MTIFGVKLGLKLLGAIVLGILILLLVTCGPAACNKIRSLQAQSRINEGQQGALRNSAADAINTQGTINQNALASEELSRTNAEEIRNAKGANATIDPELDAAIVRAFCRRRASAHDPKCRMQQPHP